MTLIEFAGKYYDGELTLEELNSQLEIEGAIKIRGFKPGRKKEGNILKECCNDLDIKFI